MTEEFIPYEEALALKELGFNEKCMSYYECGVLEDISYYSEVNEDNVIAPLWQQAFKWFRKEHGRYCHVDYSNVRKGYSFHFQGDDIKQTRGIRTKYDSYEEAELAGLRKLIENCKQK